MKNGFVEKVIYFETDEENGDSLQMELIEGKDFIVEYPQDETKENINNLVFVSEDKEVEILSEWIIQTNKNGSAMAIERNHAD